nr:hypothetical protein [Dulcicalothrix desertica]
MPERLERDTLLKYCQALNCNIHLLISDFINSVLL